MSRRFSRVKLERGCNLMQGYLFSKPVDKNQLDWLVTSPDAPWRAVLSDPDSWTPPSESEPGAAGANGRVELGRLGLLRSGARVDPDEDLYPVLKTPMR